ncbi:MAG TPA: uracil phosphoribosyltransferase [Parasegetibacter sp.]|jgi:uracil phosphoribosyltransferase
MVVNLTERYSLLCNWVSELRDISIQNDRMRFRKNLERIGEAIAYELSKEMPWVEKETTTPLGVSTCKVLKEQPVLATILRAGLPMHQGMLNFFDQADCAFISAYRKHKRDGSFVINLEYITCPSLEDRIVILIDPMLATGSSIIEAIRSLRNEGRPAAIYVVSAIACTVGIEYVLRYEPTVKIWCGAIDDELTAKGYIVPGLGDAGDLAFGTKTQD